MHGLDDLILLFREGKYIPLPQRQREMNRERERGERGPGGPPPHNRLSGGYRSTPPSSSSPRPPLPSAAAQPGVSPSERNSPLSSRGGAYAPHHPQGSPSPGPGSGTASPYTPASPGGSTATPASASTAPSPASPPASHGHSVPHSHSLPHLLSEAGRPVNGGKNVKLYQKEYVLTDHWVSLSQNCKEPLFLSLSVRTSPKAQRPPQSSRTVRAANSHAQTTGTFDQLLQKICFYIIKVVCLKSCFPITSLQPLALLNQALPRTRLT